jgi:hypothetical protein
MAKYANNPLTTVVAWGLAALLIGLNRTLLLGMLKPHTGRAFVRFQTIGDCLKHYRQSVRFVSNAQGGLRGVAPLRREDAAEIHVLAYGRTAPGTDGGNCRCLYPTHRAMAEMLMPRM